jgi:3D (Asp-Asp-Asp) domain-containing protein
VVTLAENQRHDAPALSRRATALKVVLALVAVASAVGVKRLGPGPAFVALDPVASAPIKTVAPAPDTAVVETVAFVAEPAGETPRETITAGEDGAEIFTPAPGAPRYFNGRPIRPARVMWMVTTAYSPDHRSCGKWADGKTASLKSVWTNAMESVAADTRLLPFGTLVSVPGYAEGRVAPVLDRGGAIKGARLDLLYPTHEIARRWGVQRLPVTIWEYADEG